MITYELSIFTRHWHILNKDIANSIIIGWITQHHEMLVVVGKFLKGRQIL